jgi:hypothetical protein
VVLGSRVDVVVLGRGPNLSSKSWLISLFFKYKNDFLTLKNPLAYQKKPATKPNKSMRQSV